jgi:hypothetical protein
MVEGYKKNVLKKGTEQTIAFVPYLDVTIVNNFGPIRLR